MPFPAVIDISNPDGVTVTRLDGAGPGDTTGWVVASAGDFNGDGFDDVLISSVLSAATIGWSVYLVFGSASGPPVVDLSTIDGTNGFRIEGIFAETIGRQLSGIGDINGDGFDDVVIGAYGLQRAIVLLGRADGFDAVMTTEDIDGTNGFFVDEATLGDSTASGVNAAGDLNGDGLADFIVSTRRSSDGAYRGGGAYVVYGSTDPFPLHFSLADIDGTNGFHIIGPFAYAYVGKSVSAAGDINGDGYQDLILGAESAYSGPGHYEGMAFVVFGQAGGLPAVVDLAALDGSNGFAVTGEHNGDNLGIPVSGIGDINGDGFADVLISAVGNDDNAVNSGKVYVVFGGPSFGATVDLTALDGTNGFVIEGVDFAEQLANFAADGPGDLNGDGIDDLVVGSNGAAGYGLIHVVFGRTTGFSAVLDVTSLTGSDGFTVIGVQSYDDLGTTGAFAGDFNGDGITDLIVGAGRFEHYDSYGASLGYSGATYIIYGRSDPVNATGSGIDETLRGAGAADSLSGLGGKDTLSGLAGDDVLDGGDGADLLYGGLGADDLVGGAGSDILHGDDGADDLDGGDGSDKLFGGAGADDLIGGLGNDRFDGGAGTDVLDGGDGNDYLEGGTGADQLIGGTGNDVYIVDNAGDQTIEAAGGGYDIVRTGLSWTLASEIEGLELQGSGDIDGTGNNGANNLQGNSGANRLDGGAGVDTINGGDGDDIIIGGLGNDLLRGGTGADVFRVAHVATGTLETDQVYDFSAAEGDILDLSGAYAGTLALVSSFGKHAGEMTLSFAGGITTLRLDTNGDGRVDYQMKINGDVTAESGDWLL